MQRQIKFRAWDKSTSSRVENMRYWFDGFSESVDVLEEVWKHFDESGYIIQQFSGLQTQSGRDIFEGDIFNTKAARWKCIFDEGCFKLECIWSAVIPIGKRDFLNALLDQLIYLGNELENPELLKVP